MSELQLSCECGSVGGTFHNVSPETTIRLTCYCDDCQEFARTLGRAEGMLDPHGGTDAVQCTLPQLSIDRGHEHLRSLRLKPGGLLRWHTDCCRLPIANTISAKVPFLAVLRGFISDEGAEEALGDPQFRIFGRFAKNPPADLHMHPKAPLGMLLRAGPRILKAKLRSGGRATALFGADAMPIVEPYIVSR